MSTFQVYCVLRIFFALLFLPARFSTTLIWLHFILLVLQIKGAVLISTKMTTKVCSSLGVGSRFLLLINSQFLPVSTVYSFSQHVDVFVAITQFRIRSCIVPQKLLDTPLITPTFAKFCGTLFAAEVKRIIEYANAWNGTYFQGGKLLSRSKNSAATLQFAQPPSVIDGKRRYSQFVHSIIIIRVLRRRRNTHW